MTISPDSLGILIPGRRRGQVQIETLGATKLKVPAYDSMDRHLLEPPRLLRVGRKVHELSPESPTQGIEFVDCAPLTKKDVDQIPETFFEKRFADGHVAFTLEPVGRLGNVSIGERWMDLEISRGVTARYFKNETKFETTVFGRTQDARRFLFGSRVEANAADTAVIQFEPLIDNREGHPTLIAFVPILQLHYRDGSPQRRVSLRAEKTFLRELRRIVEFDEGKAIAAARAKYGELRIPVKS